MDIEARNRSTILSAIANDFDVWEEVHVEGCAGKLRVDVVAIPKDTAFAGYAIGFEVKAPTDAMNFQYWAKVFKQAADYVGAALADKRTPKVNLKATFVYPSPPYVPYLMPSAHRQLNDDDWYRSEQLLQYAGVIHLAQHFRVGHASFRSSSNSKGLFLAMGPNPIWSQKHGWHRDGKNLLSSVRIGSTTKKSQ